MEVRSVIRDNRRKANRIYEEIEHIAWGNGVTLETKVITKGRKKTYRILATGKQSDLERYVDELNEMDSW